MEHEANPGAALELYDFIYLDKNRLVSYYAQFFQIGVPSEAKITGTESDKAALNLKADIPHLGLGGGLTAESGSQSTVERKLETQWVTAIGALETLDEAGFVYRNIAEASTGCIVLLEGSLTILDTSLMNKVLSAAPSLAEVAQNYLSEDEIVSQYRAQESVLKLINEFQLMQGELHQGEDIAWGVLTPECFLTAPASWALSYGAKIPGNWSMIAVLDGRPDSRAPDSVQFSATAGGRSLLHALQEFARQNAGRPWYAFGVTPLMIYRRLTRSPEAH